MLEVRSVVEKVGFLAFWGARCPTSPSGLLRAVGTATARGQTGVHLALFARFDWHRSSLSVTHDHRKVAQFGNIYLFSIWKVFPLRRRQRETVPVAPTCRGGAA